MDEKAKVRERLWSAAVLVVQPIQVGLEAMALAFRCTGEMMVSSGEYASSALPRVERAVERIEKNYRVLVYGER